MHGPRDADRVAFLEGVVADQVSRHLPGDAHDGNRIHQRVGQPGDGVGGAGAGGDEHDAHLAGRARITFGGVDRALLMADEDVLDAILLEQLVVDRKHGTPRITEDVLDALIGESLKHDLGACHRARHVGLTHSTKAKESRSRLKVRGAVKARGLAQKA